MTPKISLVTAVAATALAFGVPAAWGAQPSDAVERAALAGERAQQAGQVATYPDAFQRAVAAGPQAGMRDAHETSSTRPRQALLAQGARDSHQRVDLPGSPVVSPAVSSGRDADWPQIGIGFALGILLSILLGTALRATRTRELAH